VLYSGRTKEVKQTTGEKKMDLNIYIADLDAYNAGTLRGEWVDATDWEEIEETVKKISKDGEVEVMIHDYENFNLGERSDFDHVHKVACEIEEKGEAFLTYIEIQGEHAATSEGFDENYVGGYDDGKDFIEEYILPDMDIPEEIQFYIDVEAMAHDYLNHKGFLGKRNESDGMFYVFRQGATS